MSARFGWVLLVITLGCGGDDEAICVEPLRLGTFNTGFARGDIEYVDDRVAPVSAALAEQQLDLLCVQEVWLDWDALASATAVSLPNTVRTDQVADCTPPVCTNAEMDPLIACGEQNCAGLVGDELLQCGQDLCPDDVAALSAPCISCLINAAPGGIEALEPSCLGASKEGTSYLYDCHYDIGILARAPVVARASRKLDSYFVAASVDFARVDRAGVEIDVYCTHLASSIDDIPYGGAFGSWKEEQLEQVRQLVAFVEETSDGSRPIVVMGDLNTGPTEWPDNYQAILAAGFVKPPDVEGDAACTLCPDNSFSAPDASPSIVDHILLRGAASAQTSRFMRERIQLEVDGQTLESNYSDHYGVRMDLPCPPRQ